MHRLAATTIGILVATCGFVVAPASAAGTYAVTLSSSRSVADVGQTTLLQGKVGGAGAKQKLVRVDVRNGTGAWKKLGTTRTTKKGAYAFRAKVGSAGTVSYRVVAPKSKSVAQGVSKSVTLQTWRWLDLYDQPYLTEGGVVTRGVYPGLSIGGAKPATRTLGMGSGAYVYWNLDQKCDRLVAQVGMSDSDVGTTRTVRFRQAGENSDIQVTGGQGLKGFANLAASSLYSLAVSRPDDAYTYLVLPRAHCKVNVLPVAVD